MTRLDASSHSMNRSPPGSVTVAARSARPSSTAATSSAHAPVPHANVGPAPRSQTFILRWVRERTCTNSMLHLAGKAGWDSRSGPTVSNSIASRSSTKMAACGLPIDTQVAVKSKPPAEMGAASATPSALVGRVVGTLGPWRMGSPMSTLTVPSGSSVGRIGPASVSMVYVGSTGWSDAKKRARHRMPLPHISGSEPSEL
mmetsp:Transcript_22999/g.74469  ORF Transcript_22999/g.74469 Transcript_22999/m.74469 type:complete len:200 (-) Transcript_22999:308-907(-)|eukprot:scaffold1638_cov98-Isochrysis_galbana.AAC.4